MLGVSLKTWLRELLSAQKPSVEHADASEERQVYNPFVRWFAGPRSLPAEMPGSSAESLDLPGQGSSLSRDVVGSKGGLTLVWSDTIPDDDSRGDPCMRFPSGRTLW
jgi:hypothetical protein